MNQRKIGENSPLASGLLYNEKISEVKGQFDAANPSTDCPGNRKNETVTNTKNLLDATHCGQSKGEQLSINARW
jgi:hypothetical protein